MTTKIVSQWTVNEGVVWCVRHLLEDGMTAGHVGAFLDPIRNYIADTAHHYPEMTPTRLGLAGFYHFKRRREDDIHASNA